MKLSIIGTGYVGLVSGTCFAEIGHQVTCIDIDEDKISTLKKAESPIYEPGLTELLKKNIEQERLFFSTNFESITESDAIFIAVGTPSDDNGRANLNYVYQAIDQTLPLMSPDSVLVLKSTVPVGTAEKIKNHIKGKVAIVNNPEFLREGSAVSDFLHPDRIVIGFQDLKAGEKIQELYKPLLRQGNPIFLMSNVSAEMTKYAANTFLAAKISFINEVSRICDRAGADIEEVKKGIASDKRIGKEFLYAGPGYGGSCFPKDVKALKNTAEDLNLSLDLIFSIDKANYKQKEYVTSKVLNHYNGNLEGKTVALWGVSFKANTDDVRETPALNIVQGIINAGGKIQFYDPCASDNFLKMIKDDSLQKSSTMESSLEGAHALVVATEWREFQSPDFAMIKKALIDNVIFDFRNLFDAHKVIQENITYYSVGKKV